MSYLSIQSRWKSLLLVALAGAAALGSLVAVAMPGEPNAAAPASATSSRDFQRDWTER